MSKSKRLLELMMTVNAKKKFTVSELAQEFDVSYRTILRDLQELSEIGVPLYSEVGVNGGYYLLKERMLPPITFSESEAVAMFFAYQSLQFYDSLPFESESKAALKKFYHYLPEDVKTKIDEMKDRIVFWNPTREQSPKHLSLLLEAAVERNCVHIQYDSSKGINERLIQPVGLYSYNGFWFCPAYCYERNGYRLFRADRILHVSKSPYENTVSINPMSIMEWLSTEREIVNGMEMQITLTKEGVRKSKSDPWLGNLISENEDGSGVINSVISENKLEFFGEIIWGLGANACVKSPKPLVEYIIKKAKQLEQLYRS